MWHMTFHSAPRASGWNQELNSAPQGERQEPSPSDSRGLPPQVSPASSRRHSAWWDHTLRSRGAGAWKMAEGLGAKVFLTSGT